MIPDPARDVFAAPAPQDGVPARPPGSAERAGEDGSGLSIAALVFGIAAVLPCWAPLVNTISVVCALVGLGVGVPALLQARHGRRLSAISALVGTVLSAVALVVSVLVTAYTVSRALQFLDSINRQIHGY